jgi:transmembrane sensor
MDQEPENLSTVEDFLENEAFRTWLISRQVRYRVYWEEWLQQNPEKKPVYEQAVATFLALQGKKEHISNEEVFAKKEQILSQLSSSWNVEKSSGHWWWIRAVSAAAICLFFLWQFDFLELNPFAKEEQNIKSEDWKIAKNESTKAIVVLLPDNSSVLLSAGSQLRFQKHTKHAVREVFLQGEGFFEVKKSTKPFIVHTANLTTKVLGTSFQVRSFDKEATAIVRVKTGNVAVAPVESPDKDILLTVNQELKVKSNSKQVIKRESFLAEKDHPAIMAEQFNYRYTPIPKILETLEESYNMPIRYNRQLLSNCTFTGQLNDVPYLEKIRLICLTINASFEVVDNQVVIQGSNCK